MWTIAGCALLGLALWVVVDILRALRFVRQTSTVWSLPIGRFSSDSKRRLLRMARVRHAGQPTSIGFPIENDADVMDLFARMTGSTRGEGEELSESYRQSIQAALSLPSPSRLDGLGAARD